MDALQASRGIGELVLMGICSGADNAFRTTREDPRVVGLAMIESFAFETRGYELDRFLRRLTSTKAWKRRWQRGLSLRPGPAEDEEEEGTSSTGIWALPPADEVRAAVRSLAERGVRIRILLDDLTLNGQDAEYLGLDQHPNIEVRTFNPWNRRSNIGRVGEFFVR